MIPRLNVVLRTCDRVSLQEDRMVSKEECIKRCFRSLVTSLQRSGADFKLHVIDDASSLETRFALTEIAPRASYDWLPERDQSGLNNKQKSRHSVKVAYDYIDTLPADELVYIVEDDHLHFPDTIALMLDAWTYFSQYLDGVHVGIWPQDFRQMYAHPSNQFNDTYVTPCHVFPGPDRYYRTVWYTHEAFMVPVQVIRQYRDIFAELLKIGGEPHIWEGNTINQVWAKPDVAMLMPLGTLILHLGSDHDISFYSDWRDLWERNA